MNPVKTSPPRRLGTVAGLALGCALALNPLISLASDSTSAPTLQAPRPVVTEIVSADPTSQRAFSGSVVAEHEAELAFQTIGRIARLDVSPGDVVSEGQELATLDRVSLQEDVRAAEAALSSAQAEAAYAEQSYSRARALLDRNIATQATVEQALANRDATAAQVVAAQADLASAQEALTYGSLTAPMEGVVLETPVEAGTVVSSGTTVITLAALTGREAVIDVPTEFLAVLPKDARFELRRQIGGEEAVPARLRLVEPVADDTLRGRRLRLAIEDQTAFRIGSLISATYMAEARPVMTLPAPALLTEDGATYAWRVDPADRTVHKVPVETGITIGDRLEIRDGIAVGDEIVVRGAHSLEDGQTVGEREE